MNVINLIRDSLSATATIVELPGELMKAKLLQFIESTLLSLILKPPQPVHKILMYSRMVEFIRLPVLFGCWFFLIVVVSLSKKQNGSLSPSSGLI